MMNEHTPGDSTDRGAGSSSRDGHPSPEVWDRRVSLRVDGYTRLCLTAIAVLLTVLVVGLWAELPGWVGPADAQGPDGKPFINTGAQRKDILAAQEKTNAKIDELIKLLKSGQAKVQVVEEDKDKDTRGAAPGK